MAVDFTSGKIIVVLGPNASGKSEFAVSLAKKLNGEIISADSRQVYMGLDIGSGKVEGKWERKIKNQKSKIKIKVFIYKNIIHHCIDFVSPKKVFNAYDFKKCGKKALADIFSRGKIPIICGGTGFYIDALLDKINLAEIPPDFKLRKKLEKKSCEVLFNTLKKLDPERAGNIDKNNKRRLIRAIEIKLGHPMSQGHRMSKFLNNSANILYIGINRPPEILKQRIEKRLSDRLKNGMLKEVRGLHFKKRVSWKRLYDLGLEYRYVSLFLREKIKTEQEMEEKLKTAIWHYAKRQMTWFKKNKEIIWIDLSPTSLKRVKSVIKKFLTK